MGLHIGAVLSHYFVLKDGILLRMKWADLLAGA